MANTDGSIRIGVRMELEDAQKQVNQLGKQFASQTKDVEKQTQAVEKLRSQYDQLLSNTAMPEGARRLAEEFANARVEAARLDQQIQAIKAAQASGMATQEDSAKIQTLTAQMMDADVKADILRQRLMDMNVAPKAIDKMDRLAGSIGGADAKLLLLQQQAQETGGRLSSAETAAAELSARLHGIADSASVSDQRILGLNRELENLKARQKDLEAAGVGKLGYEEYDRITARIQEINSALRDYRNNLRQNGAEEASAAGRIGTLRSAMNRLTSSIVGGCRNSGSAVRGLRRNIRDLGHENGFAVAAKMAGNLFNRIKRLVISAFFFRVISRQLRKLVQGLWEYMTVNKEFTKALSGVKSNLLTAFQPIYDSVMPALAKLMEALETVTAKFAVFIATIFGTTASKAQKDAEALREEAKAEEEVGKEAEKAKKKQEKFLSSFDTIEKLGEKKEEEKKEEDEKTKPKFDTDFEQVQAPQWLLDFWKVFKDGWDQYGAPTMEAFRNAVQAIKDLIASIGSVSLKIWTGGTGLEFLRRIHELLQTIFGIISDIAGAFKTAWESAGIGNEVIGAFFYMLNAILALINSIGVSFREAWNDGTGVAICQTILEIVRNIFLIIGNLAERLREAWEANGNGVAIWRAILNILLIVLDTIKRITEATVLWSDSLNLEPLVSSIRNVLESLAPVVSIIGDTLVSIWQDTVLPFLTWLLEEAIPELNEKLSGFFDYLAENPEIIAELTRMVVAFIAAWKLTGIISKVMALLAAINPMRVVLAAILALFIKLTAESEPFREALGAAFESLGGLLKSIVELFGELWPMLEPIAEVIGGLLVSAVHAFADALSFLINIVTAAIQALKNLNDWMNSTSTSNRYRTTQNSSISGTGSSMPTAYSAAALMDNYPHLANGGVIAPNHEFLAVLGDQRSGTNIETPLATMKQAFLEAIGESGLLSSSGGGSGSAEMVLDGVTFARLIYPHLNSNKARIGVNLVTGG